MKQHITVEQLNELNDHQSDMLAIAFLRNIDSYPSKRKLYKIHSYDLPLMTIGQMIEFLGEDWIDVVWEDKYQAQWHICDALWEAVKEVFDK